jgi:Flp pilus assembly protein TadG
VVEFALIMPVFALLVFGALELGRGYYTLHLLTSAAGRAGRMASLPFRTETEVQGAVTDFLSSVGLTNSQTTVIAVIAPDGTERVGGLADALQGDRIRVTVTYSFNVLTGSIIPGFAGAVPLRAQGVYRHE